MARNGLLRRNHMVYDQCVENDVALYSRPFVMLPQLAGMQAPTPPPTDAITAEDKQIVNMIYQGLTACRRSKRAS